MRPKETGAHVGVKPWQVFAMLVVSVGSLMELLPACAFEFKPNLCLTEFV